MEKLEAALRLNKQIRSILTFPNFKIRRMFVRTRAVAAAAAVAAVAAVAAAAALPFVYGWWCATKDVSVPVAPSNLRRLNLLNLDLPRESKIGIS